MNATTQSTLHFAIPPQLDYFDIRSQNGMLTARVRVLALMRALRWMRKLGQ